MEPFRTLPEPIDGVTCANCGHPVWDHCVSEACAGCEPEGACRTFALAGFVADIPTLAQ